MTQRDQDAAQSRRDELRIESVHREGWGAGGDRTPAVGEEVYTVSGRGEVARVLGRTSDGSRLLEIRQFADPKTPFFASASNVLVRTTPVEEGMLHDHHAGWLGRAHGPLQPSPDQEGKPTGAE